MLKTVGLQLRQRFIQKSPNPKLFSDLAKNIVYPWSLFSVQVYSEPNMPTYLINDKGLSRITTNQTNILSIGPCTGCH